jgi:surfactin family lipopeptide synthetase A
MYVGLEIARIPAGEQISLLFDNSELYTAPQYKYELDYLRKLCSTLHQPDRGRVTMNNPDSLPLQRKFEVNAQTFPGAPAIRTGNKTLSYGELDTQADELALYLQRRGLLPKTFCVVKLEPSIAEVRVILAILKAGAAYVCVDPALAPQYEAAVIDVLEPQFLFVHVKEALTPEAGKLQVIRCEDEAMDLPYGWPDEAPVGVHTPACALVYARPGGGTCISMRSHHALAFPERIAAKTRRSTGNQGSHARHDPVRFWQILSKGEPMTLPRA